MPSAPNSWVSPSGGVSARSVGSGKVQVGRGGEHKRDAENRQVAVRRGAAVSRRVREAEFPWEWHTDLHECLQQGATPASTPNSSGSSRTREDR